MTTEPYKQRRGGIGGSDAAVIMGVSPWKTAGELYLEKIGEIETPDISDRDAVYWGTVLEDVVASEYSRRTDRKVRRVNRTLVHPDHPWMVGHIDRDLVGLPGILECKTTNDWAYRSDEWGDHGSDQVPVQYLLQTMHYLAVTGAEFCDLAVLAGGQRFGIYTIRRDEELIAQMIEAEEAFWSHVTGRVPIPLDYDHPRTLDIVKRRYPDVEGTRTLDFMAQSLHDSKAAIDAQIKTLTTQADAIKAQLMDMVGTAERAYLPGGGGYVRRRVEESQVSFTKKAYVDFRYSAKITQ
jgi:putative phage-type endonuclease